MTSAGYKANEIDMNNATYARSYSGENMLIQEFETSLLALRKVLHGEKYTNFTKVISENWVGMDADAFMKRVEKTVQQIDNKISQLSTQFRGAVEDDRQQFSKFQYQNSISSK